MILFPASAARALVPGCLLARPEADTRLEDRYDPLHVPAGELRLGLPAPRSHLVVYAPDLERPLSCVAGGEGPQGPGNPPANPSPSLRADLFAGPLLVPDHVRVDSVLEMVVAVRNGGTRSADAGWIVRVMLSTDPVIDSADIQVDHFSAPRDLQAGGEDQYLRHKKLRATTPTGLYYIGSILDVTGKVAEASETNNVLRSPGTIVLTREDRGAP